MFCKKCGNKINESDKFCNVCGANLQGVSYPNESKFATIINDGIKLLKSFFSKNPAKVIDESKNINSYVGGVILAITVLLYAFVSCFNITENINLGLGSINSVVNSIVSNIFGGLGDNLTDYLPDLEISPLMSLVIPYMIFAIVVSAVLLGIFYLSLKVRKISTPSLKCSLNMLGATSLPITTALIFNIFLGLVFPQITIIIFLIGVFVSAFFVYEMIKSFIDSEYKPIIEMIIVMLIVLLISIILVNSTINQITDTLKYSLMSESSQKYNEGTNSLNSIIDFLF